MLAEDFKDTWYKNNAGSGIEEEFPSRVVEIAGQIKDFMKPENRIYQGATGNAKGLLDALGEYNAQCTLESDQIARYKTDLNLIIDFLLGVRLTSQVPLNTAFFIRQRLKKLKPTDVETAKSIVNDQITFHLQNYKDTEDVIAKHLKNRIIDRCDQYEKKIIVGTWCHSTVVCKTIIGAKDYVEQVIVGKTDPEQQGILTAIDLVKAGMQVKLVDLAQFANEFRRINMFLFGVDAVSAEGTVLNKTGTRLLATLAKTKELPVYFAGSTYKYARQTLLGGLVKIEGRSLEREIFANHLGIDLSPYYAPQYDDEGNEIKPLLTTQFNAFDTTKTDLYDAVVSEVGFLPMREAFDIAWKDYLDVKDEDEEENTGN